MRNIVKKTYLIGVIERAIAYYKVEAEDARTATENWQDGEFQDRDDEAIAAEEPCNVRVRQPDGIWAKLRPSEWEAQSHCPSITKPYSVLLLYPDYANDSGAETYYAFVTAVDPIDAVAIARRQALAAQNGIVFPPDDFAPLLVTPGHNHSEPLFNR